MVSKFSHRSNKVSRLCTVPIRYYDKVKKCHEASLTDLKEIYRNCADPEMALDFTHIQKKDLLIIDGIKRT